MATRRVNRGALLTVVALLGAVRPGSSALPHRALLRDTGWMRIGNMEVNGIARLVPMAAISNAPFQLVVRSAAAA